MVKGLALKIVVLNQVLNTLSLSQSTYATDTVATQSGADGPTKLV